MHILNICETAQGGVGTYQTYLSAMRDRGVIHHHLVPSEHARHLGEIANLHVFARPGRGLRAVVNMLREVDRLVPKLRPDICIFHSTFALAGLAWLRLRRARCATIYVPHGWAIAGVAGPGLKFRVIRATEGRLCGLADRVICVSQAEKALARNFGYRGDMVTIENATPAPSPHARSDLFASEPDKLHLLFVGRLDHQKGFDILTEAMQLIKRRDVVVHVLGAPVRGKSLDGPLPESVRLEGWCPHDQVADWYASADALIVPSRWEGLPLIIPEALSHGTPVLCSEASGMESLITRGETGEHFPLDPQNLAGILENLDRTRLRAMRPACRRAYARRFTLERLHDELTCLFNEISERT